MLWGGISYAACSPGIPCTGYNIYDNNSASVDAAYSGSKTGAPAPYTNTTGATTSACDGNFMNQIYARAFLEGSREVIMSEQLIHKPDSVLEYTCFDQFVNIAAHNAGTAFSENPFWQTTTIEWQTADNDGTVTINNAGGVSDTDNAAAAAAAASDANAVANAAENAAVVAAENAVAAEAAAATAAADAAAANAAAAANPADATLAAEAAAHSTNAEMTANAAAAANAAATMAAEASANAAANAAAATAAANNAAAQPPANNPSFSGLPDQIDHSVFGTERLDNILSGLLFDRLQDYIDDNFDHTFMGESTTIDNNIDTSAIGANSYACTHMSTIWDISRCADFGEDDRFRSFEHLVNFDPRTIPQSCSPGKESNDTIEIGNDGTKLENTQAGGDDLGLGMMAATGVTPAIQLSLNKMPIDLKVTDVGGVNIDLDPVNKCPPAGDVVAGVNTGISNDIIRLANNCDDETNDDRLNIYSSFDIMELYSYMIKGAGIYMPGIETPDDKTLPKGLSLPGVITCALPIPTGIPVITYDISNSLSGNIDTMDRSYRIHLEHICPNAGCYYQPIKSPYIWGAPIPPIITGLCLPIL